LKERREHAEADTVRTSIVKETAQFLARMVAQHLDPVAYDHVHTVDANQRFRVTVQRYPGDEIDRRLSQYGERDQLD